MDFSKLFSDFIREADIDEYLDLIRKNSKGKIRLIGSFVYRNLAGIVHGNKQNVYDLDFLVEFPADMTHIPENWIMGFTHYGNPHFIRSGEKDKISIDLNYLPSFHSIVARNLEPTIENYLTGTPLTVQSIAYDIDRKRILGDVGIDAIKRGIIKVNNMDEARYEVERKNITLEKYIKQKARELGFEWRLSD